jgi:hypothetical protein
MAINYNAIITQYSWWKNISSTGTRFFCVVERRGEPHEGSIRFNTVVLIEVGKTEPQYPSWPEMISWIENGIMEQVSK